MMRIAQQEWRKVYQHLVAVYRLGFKSPQNRLSKSFFNRIAFVWIVTHRTIGVIGLHQQHLWAAFYKFYNACPANLSAIEAKVVRAYARRQRVYIQKFRVEFVYFQQYMAGFFVPI